MAYVIAEPCIGTKDNSCVEVCPVDCIHPTPDEPDYDSVEMLYIDPDECIDCDACVEACPVDACFAEDQLPDEWQKFAQINADYFKQASCALLTKLSALRSRSCRSYKGRIRTVEGGAQVSRARGLMATWSTRAWVTTSSQG